jgi:3D (Asp-Asp-Asp) domain-containing protein
MNIHGIYTSIILVLALCLCVIVLSNDTDSATAPEKSTEAPAMLLAIGKTADVSKSNSEKDSLFETGYADINSILKDTPEIPGIDSKDSAKIKTGTTGLTSATRSPSIGAVVRRKPVLPPIESSSKNHNIKNNKKYLNEYKTVKALVTAYCPCWRCCGSFANGRTSIGKSAWNPGIAADPSKLPYGTEIIVPGYGKAKVDDTGIAMRRSWRRRGVVHLDVRFDYHWQARQWGSKIMNVKVKLPKED